MSFIYKKTVSRYDQNVRSMVGQWGQTVLDGRFKIDGRGQGMACRWAYMPFLRQWKAVEGV